MTGGKADISISYAENTQEEAMMDQVLLLRRSVRKSILYGLLVLSSGGLFYLLCRWVDSLHTWMLYSPVSSLSSSYQALSLKVKNADNRWEIITTQ